MLFNGTIATGAIEGAGSGVEAALGIAKIRVILGLDFSDFEQGFVKVLELFNVLFGHINRVIFVAHGKFDLYVEVHGTCGF